MAHHMPWDKMPSCPTYFRLFPSEFCELVYDSSHAVGQDAILSHVFSSFPKRVLRTRLWLITCRGTRCHLVPRIFVFSQASSANTSMTHHMPWDKMPSCPTYFRLFPSEFCELVY